MNLSFLRLILLSLSLWALTPLQAQQIQLEAAVTGQLSPERLRNLQWRPQGDQFSYISPTTQNLMGGSVKGKDHALLSLSELNEQIGRELRYFPNIQWLNETSFYFPLRNQIWMYDLQGSSAKVLTELPEEAANIELGPDQSVAFTVDYNLYAGGAGTANWQALTEDGTREIVYGEAVHRSEFGIRKGLFWSPKGNFLAFYRMDQTPVTDYPRIDYADTPADDKPIKYPMAGQASHHVTIGILNLATRNIQYLETGTPEDQYLTNITWSPDESEIWVAILNRDQNNLELTTFDPKSGRKKAVILRETDDKYVEPEHGPIFLPESPDRFIWMSERNEFNHLYLYTKRGKLISQLTHGNWMVTDFLGFDEKGELAYFTATEASPLESHVYSVDVETDELTKITQETGTHFPFLSEDGKYLLDMWSSRSVPSKTQIIDVKTGEWKRTIHEAPNPLAGMDLGEMSIFPLKAENGTNLYCRLIKPANFDESQTYPVLVYVYGGPHAQLVRESWLGGAQLFLQHMAQKGYVVFTLDNRGSANRGLGFEQAVFRQLGEAELADQLVGVEYLKTLPFVDPDRMAVYGWSFGGFMATSLMTRHAGTFQVGVAGGPVIDWSLYEAMYTERYMDAPQQNPTGYAKANLLQYADQLEGKLLMIHGLQDDVVVPQHSTRFVRECVKKGIQLDYFPYPAHPHNVRGRDRAHLLHKVSDYIDLHLAR
ncbi:S9 family peptidase [Pontibacter sp. G13]|uniref:S9 family peptidase n=1 Tax=Pontibacter sp. G13 TaxID=3074898 RepID=UPI00288A9F2F|nr:S9 family peptidase [Pontibacter sp. G13]WNJ19608.1 S9 family peptidase [Pontibacter sp. G13]